MATANEAGSPFDTDDNALPDTWTLFTHWQSDTSTYTTSYEPFYIIRTCEDWGAMIAHAIGAHDLIHANTIPLIQSRAVSSLSFFRNSITPTWEDPDNATGVTYAARANVSVDAARDMWTRLTCEGARGAEAFNGIVATRKISKLAPFLKVELWLARDDPATIERLGSLVNLHFCLVDRRI